ncbi:MAG: hypothetical protein IJ759_05245 [Bacteroidales bacterium]|nr:hypothetical protein [Bacteroidales bacterium]
MFAHVNPRLTEIESKRDYLEYLIKFYPKFYEEWYNRIDNKFKEEARIEADGDPDIEATCYRNNIYGIDDLFGETKYLFYNSMLIMVYSFYDESLNKILQDENIERTGNIKSRINSILNKNELTDATIEDIKYLDRYIRLLRNRLGHNNTEPLKDSDVSVKELVNKEPEIHLLKSTNMIFIDGDNFILRVLDKEYRVLKEIVNLLLNNVNNKSKGEKEMEYKEKVTFLLGAGFSIPAGYPSAQGLVDKISEYINTYYRSNSRDILSGSEKYLFLGKLMCAYAERNQPFNYEKFFDFLKEGDGKDSEFYKNKLRSAFSTKEYDELRFNVESTYQDIIANCLQRSDETMTENEKYNSILYYMEQLLNESNLIDVFTLNHDLLFESFNKSSYIQGNITDGFEEIGSPYYGELNCKNHKYNCRLERYTGNYNQKKSIRLFKLHGSIDYYIYHNLENNEFRDESWIKIKKGITTCNFKKEVNGEYKEDFTNYSPFFLTGVNSKQKKYKKGIFKSLFKEFEKTLSQTTKLIIIGYSGCDDGINSIIREKYKGKNIYIIDPKSDDVANNFSKFNVTKINKGVNELTKDDFIKIKENEK